MDFYNNLKVGQKVIYKCDYQFLVLEVIKITKTYIEAQSLLNLTYKFTKSGYVWGISSAYRSSRYLTTWSIEDYNAHLKKSEDRQEFFNFKQALISKINKLSDDNLPLLKELDSILTTGVKNNV